MRISDWSSDVGSSDLGGRGRRLAVLRRHVVRGAGPRRPAGRPGTAGARGPTAVRRPAVQLSTFSLWASCRRACGRARSGGGLRRIRSEEHTSELQSLMRISYAVFCLKKNIYQDKTHEHPYHMQNTYPFYYKTQN